MIGYVRGIVTHLFKESCYVDVHGVGTVCMCQPLHDNN